MSDVNSDWRVSEEDVRRIEDAVAQGPSNEWVRMNRGHFEPAIEAAVRLGIVVPAALAAPPRSQVTDDEIKQTYTKPEHGWTCFHCGEVFTTVGGARDHFGAKPDATPGCMVRVQLGDERGLLMALRRAEAEIERLRSRSASPAGSVTPERVSRIRADVGHILSMIDHQSYRVARDAAQDLYNRLSVKHSGREPRADRQERYLANSIVVPLNDEPEIPEDRL